MVNFDDYYFKEKIRLIKSAINTCNWKSIGNLLLSFSWARRLSQYLFSVVWKSRYLPITPITIIMIPLTTLHKQIQSIKITVEIFFLGTHLQVVFNLLHSQSYPHTISKSIKQLSFRLTCYISFPLKLSNKNLKDWVYICKWHEQIHK